ncbi:MAG: CsgG/HfaB family protein [Spirochaetes bacterium]|nr:CsgG/HfaB family protein [Spirochaetota bacterium]MBU1080820.1 CsgG/HfaB family protein [Spirochaetota bacterium]
MTRRGLLAAFLAAQALSAFAQYPSREASRLVDSLAATVADGQLSRRPVAVLEFRNASPLAERNLVGQAFSVLVEAAVTDSLVFRLVDRRNLGAYLEEIELALADPTGSAELDAGMFIEAEYFIDGAVTEENGEFRVSARLVATETAAVVAEASALMPAAGLISLGESYGYQFVSANGIGMGVRLGPTHLAAIYGAPPVAVGREDPTIFGALGGGAISYRLSRGLKLSLGFDFDIHNVYKIADMTFGDVRNMPDLTEATLAGMTYLPADDSNYPSAGQTVAGYILGTWSDYQVSRLAFAGSLAVSGVLNMSRSLNVSIGAGPALGTLDYTQTWDRMPIRYGETVTLARKELHHPVIAPGAVAEAGVEWFVLPRFALALGAKLVWLFPVPILDDEWRSQNTNEHFYGPGDISSLSFGLNPYLLPDGTPWSDTRFPAWWAYAYLGATFYL